MDATTLPTGSPRFDSLTDLQNAHAELVTAVGAHVLSGENRDRIAQFIARAAATGAVLDAKDDRAAARGCSSSGPPV